MATVEINLEETYTLSETLPSRTDPNILETETFAVTDSNILILRGALDWPYQPPYDVDL